MKFCPVCKSNIISFLPGGVKKRPDVKCPSCGSRERYRLLTLYLQKKTDFFNKQNHVLEIGPDKGFAQLCKSAPKIKYTSIDLLRDDAADMKMDATSLQFSNNRFDYIICFHVLEHVKDDLQALKEIKRVLKKTGLAIISVPLDINRQKTFELKRKLNDKERERIYGQRDHLRIYGINFENTLNKGGLSIKKTISATNFSKSEMQKFGLKNRYPLQLYNTEDILYLCKST